MVKLKEEVYKMQDLVFLNTFSSVFDKILNKIELQQTDSSAKSIQNLILFNKDDKLQGEIYNYL